ncbi:MAG TPA: Hsp20/alpha crystallin family protein [Drouetiella sp.]|jgi:HSP20 family protein
MNPIVSLYRYGKRKAPIAALSLGLAVGFASGFMMHGKAEGVTKPDKAEAESHVTVHTGKSVKPHGTESDTKGGRLHGFAASGIRPSGMFMPWWWSPPFNSDADLLSRNFDFLGSDFGMDWPSSSRMVARSPRLETSEQSNEVKVTAEVPGVDEKDLDVTVNDDSVTIKGIKREEISQDKAGKGDSSTERSFSSFERSVWLPCKVQADKAEAVLKNGVLKIIVPKSQLATTEGRKIAIRKE